tara:strand:- start:209 stop:1030 length:822 start_codon:yes stop_codon:yes gene_type:complete
MFNNKLNNLTIVIVSFKSEKVIFKTLSRIKKIKNILILDNSSNINLKKKVQKKYRNIIFHVSRKNLGYGAGNNFLLKKVKTQFALILNPDCFASVKDVIKVLNFMNKVKKKCAIIGSTKDSNNIISGKLLSYKFYRCMYVKGFFMLFDLNKIKKIGYFDGNFFMYLEEIDLCKRVIDNGYEIYSLKGLKLKHLGGKSSSDRKQFLKLQNWHWMWSKFYFEKKHSGLIFSYLKYLPVLLITAFKTIISPRNIKYKMRLKGLYYSMAGKKSDYRG